MIAYLCLHFPVGASVYDCLRVCCCRFVCVIVYVYVCVPVCVNDCLHVPAFTYSCVSMIVCYVSCECLRSYYLCQAAETRSWFGGTDLQMIQVLAPLVVHGLGEAHGAALLVDAEQIAGVHHQRVGEALSLERYGLHHGDAGGGGVQVHVNKNALKETGESEKVGCL